MRQFGSSRLLLAPLGIVLAGLLVLIAKKHILGFASPTELLAGMDWSFAPWLGLACVLAVFIQVLLVRCRADSWLFPIALTLVSVGAVEIGRLKMALFAPQLRWLCVALLGFLGVLSLWRQWQRLLDYP